LVGRGVGHCVAEASLGDFTGGIIYEYDCCGVFWEGVDGVDFFRAMDCVGDRCGDIASWDAGEHGEECEGNEWGLDEFLHGALCVHD